MAMLRQDEIRARSVRARIPMLNMAVVPTRPVGAKSSPNGAVSRRPVGGAAAGSVSARPSPTAGASNNNNNGQHGNAAHRTGGNASFAATSARPYTSARGRSVGLSRAKTGPGGRGGGRWWDDGSTYVVWRRGVTAHTHAHTRNSFSRNPTIMRTPTHDTHTLLFVMHM